jgi:hypothetical protein
MLSCISIPNETGRTGEPDSDPIAWPSIVAAIESYAETQLPEVATDLREWASVAAGLAEMQDANPDD